MKKYNLINNVTGWIAFLISAVTYILTTEASASFWDCGEFISTADKLLVGHPPGAPLFMIIARMFAIAAPDIYLVAKFVNIMSALASAFTILFLFWTITHLARKIFIDGAAGEDGEVEPWRIWSVMGAGLVGSLAYTFSDTFWFSAVEGEVYAMSSLFTAMVFWAILKWENAFGTPRADKWIVLIAYLMGLSIGVHLLNLLCIPAIGLVYYYKRYEGRTTLKGVLTALMVSCVVLGVILYGIIPGLVKVAGGFELFFVNSLGMPYNSGAIFWMLLLCGLVVAGIVYTYKHGQTLANTIVTSVAVIVLGYSSFAMIVIRSAADPTMDQNSPDNVFSLIDYLNREQYGDRPLFYGQTFVSPMDYTSDSEGAPVYVKKSVKGQDSYVAVDHKPEYKYQACMPLPRMYSSTPSHVAQYKAWSGYTEATGKKVKVMTREGGATVVSRPTFGQNLTFFLRYQVSFMYWRYFMWNFSGRQNDIQSHGELTHGNWITGIPFIDDAMLGDQDKLPDTLKANKGHNTYYMLPLLLGLAGLFFQYGRGKSGVQGFWVVMLLFLMTGLAIVLYLNQTPLQPRERDYAYAGSFYAFAIWIGLGVLSIVEGMRGVLKSGKASAIASTIICLLAVPTVMAQQNWDDHDRSGCTITRDIAYNYLNSCDENAVIFTNGDNDTFPLWYAQEVEGCRTDVRVCNLSYLQTDWYADQMKRKAYESAPLPISFTHEEYSHDRDVVYLLDQNKGYMPLDTKNGVIEFLHSEDPRTRYQGYKFIPGHRFMMEVDKKAVESNQVVSASRMDQVVDTMRFGIGEGYILKNQMFVLDMLANSKWERPLYYAVTVGRENYCGLENYFQLEGLAYRVSPILKRPKDNGAPGGSVDTEKMYDKVMNKFRWGFYNDPDIYLDENKTRMGSNFRNNMTRLATALIEESEGAADSTAKREMALNVLDKIETELPSKLIPHNYFSLEIAEDYYRLGEDAKGDAIIREFALDNFQELSFYTSLEPAVMRQNFDTMRRNLAIFYEIQRVLENNGRDELTKELDDMYATSEQLASEIYNAMRQ